MDKEKLPRIPLLVDLIQEYEKKEYEIPEIRVWCHPLKGGDDYYYVFDTFKQAVKFSKTHTEAESVPLIAFRGYEINIFDLKQRSVKKGKKTK